jgi:hypothetical protein
MEPVAVGDLVHVAGGGTPLDGIVFDIPNRSKVVVAVVDPSRGPGFRSVPPGTLTMREKESSDDPALRLLIRRTQSPVRGATHDGVNVRKGAAGFTRGASHRSTGR